MSSPPSSKKRKEGGEEEEPTAAKGEQEPVQSLFEHALEADSAGLFILEYLRYPDIQRLACTCTFLKDIATNKEGNKYWSVVETLRDYEVLMCLWKHPYYTKNIMKSKKNHPDRYRAVAINAIGNNEQSPPRVYPTIYDAFEDNMMSILFMITGTYNPIPFSQITEEQLSDMLRCGDDPDLIYESFRDDPDEKKKGLCHSPLCKHKDEPMDLYFYGTMRRIAYEGTRYLFPFLHCGYCMDENFLLKLKYLKENFFQNSRQRPFTHMRYLPPPMYREDNLRTCRVPELPGIPLLNPGNQGMSPEQLGINDDSEFWVRLMFERPDSETVDNNYGEITFVGVGEALDQSAMR